MCVAIGGKGRPARRRTDPAVSRKTAATVAWTAMIAALAVSGCAKRAAPPAGGFAMPVSAAPIARGTIAQYFDVTGSVDARKYALLSSVAAGTVMSVAAQVGDHVHQGQLLVQIDDRTLRAQLAQAEANLAQVSATNVGGQTTAQANLAAAEVADTTAQANLRRNVELFNQGYVSKSALETVQQQAASADAAYRAARVAEQNASLDTGADSAAAAAIANAQAAVRALSSQVSQAGVTAPFDGVVTARNVDPGSLATPGTTLMEVAQLDPVYVDVGISEVNLPQVRVGTPVTISVAGIAGRTWQGRVEYLNLYAQPGSLIYTARIPLANPDLRLRGGMIASAQFVQAQKSGVLLAPRAAVFQTDAGYAMFIIDGGKAKSIPIEIGIENDQQVEVAGPGLKPGVQAILNHSVTLQPGTPVQILPPQSGARY